MMTVLKTLCLLFAGVIHLLPLIGVLGPHRLAKLYWVDFSDPNLEILMRHRAVLFGLLGLFIIASLFRGSLQWMAVGAGLMSAVSFLWLALSVSGYNQALSRVVYADVVAIGGLLLAGLILYFEA